MALNATNSWKCDTLETLHDNFESCIFYALLYINEGNVEIIFYSNQ